MTMAATKKASSLRRKLIAACALVLAPGAIVGSSVVACSLVDPVPEDRTLPSRPPSIVTESVAPTLAQPLLQFPSQFVVPVQLYNPTVTFYWGVFVDYDPSFDNPSTNNTLAQSGQGAGTPNSNDLQVVSFSLPDVYATGCHRIDFLATLDVTRSHTTSGANVVTWFYTPGGNVGACFLYDAGPFDGGDADAGAGDASDGQ